MYSVHCTALPYLWGLAGCRWTQRPHREAWTWTGRQTGRTLAAAAPANKIQVYFSITYKTIEGVKEVGGGTFPSQLCRSLKGTLYKRWEQCCTLYSVQYRRWEGVPVIIGRVSIPTLPFIEGVQEVGGGNNPVFPIRIILFFLSSDPYWQKILIQKIWIWIHTSGADCNVRYQHVRTSGFTWHVCHRSWSETVD